jgi:hypothetical protein
LLTYWYKYGVLAGAEIFKPFTEATHSCASSSPHCGVGIDKTSLYKRPYIVHQRVHILAASLNANTQGKYGTSPIGWFWGGKILHDQGM